MNFTHPFDAAIRTQPRARRFEFPVGYHALHSDVSLNFQMNRFFNWVGDHRMLNEMREVSPYIANAADFTREFTTLAERALNVRECLKGAYYYAPLHQFHDQVNTLRNVRSVTTRIFTQGEHAHNHCHVGNLALSLQAIVTWLDSMTTSNGKALQ